MPTSKTTVHQQELSPCRGRGCGCGGWVLGAGRRGVEGVAVVWSEVECGGVGCHPDLRHQSALP